MSRIFVPFFILFLIVLMDIYGFSAIRTVFGSSSPKAKQLAYTIYWSITAGIVLFFIYSMMSNLRLHSTSTTRFIMGIIMGIFVSKILLTLLLGIEDITRFLFYIINKLSAKNSLDTSRRQFLDTTFLLISSLPIFAFIHGMVKSAFDFKVYRTELFFPNLPTAFEGFKIIQISDIHSGSFSQTEPLEQAIQTINSLEPDLFVFTGDLVNNMASEFEPYIPIFSKIKAKHGQYSILGNHDYGDYVQWDTPEEKAQNFETIKAYHEKTNWKLLLNQSIEIKQGNEKIALIGVENWGAKMNFRRNGDLKKANQCAQDIPFKVLLSHDPSHWDAEVRPQYKDIDLMLSGHTHGMQFGIETKYFRFSPVQWVYEQWAGIYTVDAQKLYVNRGFGCLGYPGRVGILPEITELILRRG